MAWVVDTCLLIDIAEADPTFGTSSVKLLDEKRPDGLVICPVSFVELAPVFGGDAKGLAEFLEKLTINWPELWMTQDTHAGFDAWGRYVAQKREGKIGKRPIADVHRRFRESIPRTADTQSR